MIPTCERTKQFFAPIEAKFDHHDVFDISVSPDREHFILDTYIVSGQYRYPNLFAGAKFIERLPEKKSIKQVGKIEPVAVPITDIFCELLNALVPDVNIVWSDGEAREIYLAILSKSLAQDEISKAIANFKVTGIVPEHDYELCADKPLKPYQQVGLYGTMHSTGFGLFMEQGTGKTPISIAAICNLSQAHKRKQLRQGVPHTPYRVCIVVPNQVRLNWWEEICNFTTVAGKVTIIRGTALDRVKRLIEALQRPLDEECDYTIVIVGYKTLWRSWEFIGKTPWDLSILDEGHEARNIKAKQTQMVLELRDISARRIVMTGTPWANSICDYYTLLEFMDKGNSGFGSLKTFKKFYTTCEERRAFNGQVFEKETGTQNLPFLQERLMRCSYFISLKEALPDLPDIVYDIVEVEMTPKQEDCYRKVQNELVLQIEQTQNSGMQREMMISCILTQLLRLNQITSGFVTWDEILDIAGKQLQPKHIEWCDNTNPKAEALADLLFNKPANEKSIIWANWIPDIQYINYVAKRMGIEAVTYCSSLQTDAEKEAALHAFNWDREVQWLIGTPASGGAGVNALGYPPGHGDEYDTNCTHQVYYSQDWSQIKRSQSEKRPHRTGTRCQVRCTDLVVAGSIDEEIRHAVLMKKVGGMEVADLSRIMQKLTSSEFRLQ